MRTLKTRLLLLSALVLALGIRLYDLNDPPFDFHATRQFRSAVIARGIYYAQLDAVTEIRRAKAIQQWHNEQQLEPPLLEWLTALTYQLPGGEVLWKARILSSFFWVLGGIALYALICELISPIPALVSTLVYLFLPFGIIASRSFQSDPWMVSMTVIAVWQLYCWHRRPTWRSAVLAGSLSGVAILIKAVATFPIGCVAIALLIFDGEWKKHLRNGQTWLAGLLALGPGLIYYINGLFISGFLKGQASQSFLPNLWLTPNYYLRWAGLGASVAGLGIIFLGLLGIFLWRSKTGRIVAIGWWVGYGIYGLAFPYHMMTHDYYHLPLIPLIAFSLAPILSWVEGILRHCPQFLPKIVILLVVGWGAFQIVTAQRELARKSYPSDAEEWSRFQTIIPTDLPVVALVQAYGYPLKYYGWTDAVLWMNTGDIALRELAGQSTEQIEQKRWAQLEGMDLFLITNFNEFDRQPDLHAYLTANFRVFDEGSGYVIYDLRASLDE